jgi:hypothetical protein
MAKENRRPWTPEERRAYAEKCEEVAQSFRDSARREGPRHYRILCPFCTSSKTGRADYSMNVGAATGVFHCFRCDERGKLRAPPDADLAELEQAEREAEQPDEVGPPEGFIPLGHEPGLSAESLAEARAYAAKRFITPELARTLRVGAVLDGYYAGRLILPVLDADGVTWRGWVGRDWTGLADKPYLYPRGMPRGKFMFNHGALWDATDDPLLIVEGVLDAIPFWPDAAAVLGKPSNDMVEDMERAERPLVICLDGDAWREGHALALRLQLAGRRAGALKLPPRKDPDELVETIKARMHECIGEFSVVEV